MSQSSALDDYMTYMTKTKTNSHEVFSNPFSTAVGGGSKGSSSSNLQTLRKSVTHSGHGRRSVDTGATGATGGMSDNDDDEIRAYQYVHLHENPPEYLQPLTPRQLLKREAAKKRHTEALRRAASPDSMRSLSRGRRSKAQDDETQPKKLRSALRNPKNKPTAKSGSFQTRVSFDTVNLQFSDEYRPGEDDNDDHGYDVSPRSRNDSSRSILDDEFGFTSTSDAPSRPWRSPSPLGRNRSVSPGSSGRDLSPRGRSSSTPNMTLSPPGSSGDRSLSPASPRRTKSASPLFRKYPTTPIITHDSCTATKKHRLFDDLYSGRLKPRTAKLPDRNVLCYVSGRKHTWVAIDWVCNRLLEDGDTLIIIASIRPNWSGSLQRRLSSGSVFAVENSLVTEEGIRRSPEYTRAVADNLMKYTLSLLSTDKIIKVVVELSVGNTKDVLKDMYSLYNPVVVATSTKPTAAPSTKAWQTSRITDRMVKNFPVPVIIVPARNMDLFQKKLFNTLDKRMVLASQQDNRIDDAEYVEGKEIKDLLAQAGDYTLEDQMKYLQEYAPDEKAVEEDLSAMMKSNPEVEKMLFESIESDSAEESFDSEEESNDEEEGLDADTAAGRDTTPAPHEKTEDRSSPAPNRASAPALKLTTEDGVEVSDPHRESTADSDGGVSDTDEDEDDRVSYMTNKDSASFQLMRHDWDAQVEIYKELAKIESAPFSEDTFKDMLGTVSDTAYGYGVYLAERVRDGGHEASLVRTMTEAPDVAVYRSKSMIPDDIASAPKDSFKKKSASGSSPMVSPTRSSTATMRPMIKVESPAYEGVSSKPRSQSLRFNLSSPTTSNSSVRSADPRSSISPVSSKSRAAASSARKSKSVSAPSSSELNPPPKRERKKSFFKKLFS